MVYCLLLFGLREQRFLFISGVADTLGRNFVVIRTRTCHRQHRPGKLERIRGAAILQGGMYISAWLTTPGRKPFLALMRPNNNNVGAYVVGRTIWCYGKRLSKI